MKGKRPYRYSDWPKSTVRIGCAPGVPIYVSVPFWRGQLPVINKIADHLVIASPDVVGLAALSYVTTFATREALFAAIAQANDLYAVRGKVPKLAFPLEWSDTPWGRCSAKSEGQLSSR